MDGRIKSGHDGGAYRAFADAPITSGHDGRENDSAARPSHNRVMTRINPR